MRLKRQFTIALLGTGVALSGCQTPMSGLAFWKKDANSQVAASPDVSKQKFDGLSKQFGANSSGVAARPSGTALGGKPATESGNFLTASWKKTTAAVSGAFTPKSKGDITENDPLRLDRPVKKVGPEVYVSAARLLENQNKFPEAEGQYQKALQAAPGDLNALVGLARLQDRQGNPGEAIKLYQQALKTNPSSTLIYNDLGLCHARQREYDASLQALNKAVELQPTNAKYRNNLAAVLVEAGRPDDALPHLLSGNTPAVAHYNLGYLLQQRGQRELAEKHYRQAVALEPGMAPAHEMLAQLSGNRGEPVANQSPIVNRAAVQPPATQPAAPPVAAATPSSPPARWGSYGAGAADEPVYTVAPQLPATAGEPAAQSASRQNAWSAGESLPPIR